MILLRPQRWGRQPPPAGATLLAGHPLAVRLRAYWLFNAGGGGQIADLATPAQSGRQAGSTAAWAATPVGLGNRFTGSGRIDIPTPTRLLADTTGPRTVAGWCTLTTTGTNGGNGQHIIWTDSSYILRAYDFNGGTLQWYVETGFAFKVLNVSPVLPLNTPLCVVGTWDGTTQAVYVNGVLAGSQTPGGSTTMIATSYSLGNDPTGVGPLSGGLSAVAVWHRALQPAEVQQLAAEPYAMVAPPAPRLRYWIVVSAGVTGTGALTIRKPALSGSGTTTVTGTGSLTIRKPALAATGTTTVTGTGALTIRHPLLSGTGAFVNATGALTIRHPTLSGSGTTTVTGTGALSISHPTLAASGAQGPTATGVLTLAHPTLSATGTTTVTGTGALTIGHPSLAATGTTTVTGTGSVTIQHPTLLGAAPGTVTGSAALLIHHPTLAATGTTTITATGALTVRHPLLAATGTTTVTGTGSLTIRHPLLSGTAPATITGTGALAVRHPVLAGLGTTTIVGTGSITIRHPLLAASDQPLRDIAVTIGAGTTGWLVGAGAAGWAVGEGQT